MSREAHESFVHFIGRPLESTWKLWVMKQTPRTFPVLVPKQASFDSVLLQTFSSVFLPIFALFLCTSGAVLKTPALIIDLSIFRLKFSFHFFAPCILKLCCYKHVHLNLMLSE